jgi:hypothetical protein
MAARPALSLHHQITPASPESEKGAFVRGKIPRISPVVACSNWSPTIAPNRIVARPSEPNRCTYTPIRQQFFHPNGRSTGSVKPPACDAESPPSGRLRGSIGPGTVPVGRVHAHWTFDNVVRLRARQFVSAERDAYTSLVGRQVRHICIPGGCLGATASHPASETRRGELVSRRGREALLYLDDRLSDE